MPARRSNRGHRHQRWQNHNRIPPTTQVDPATTAARDGCNPIKATAARLPLDSHEPTRHPAACHAAPEPHPGPRPSPRPEAEGVLHVSLGPAPGSAYPLRRAARPGRLTRPRSHPASTRCPMAAPAPGRARKGRRMHSVDTTGLPAATAAPAWSAAGLVELTARLAGEAGASAAQARARAGLPGGGPADRAWSVPLLVTAEAEAWLLGWPAGLVAPAHDHRGTAVALSVLEGTLSEECLDPTIWTTGRRTTWRAGSTTLFPPGHVHLLGAAGNRPAVAVHAWSGPAGSAGGGAGRPALGRAAAVAGGGPGGGRTAAEPVRVRPGRGGHACLVGQAADGALDLGHVRDRVAR